MGNWEIIVPEAETNLVTNPSIEITAADYAQAGGGGTVARVSTKSRRGAYSLECTPAAVTTDGATTVNTISLVSGTTYTFSVDVWGVLNIPYKLMFVNSTRATIKATQAFTGTGDWERIYLTWTADATAGFHLYVTKNDSASTDPFYTDGWHLSAVNYETTYVDGEQKGCKWNGTPHASTSTRDAQERSGGRIYNLDDLSVNVLEETGIGMPPVSHLVQNKALFPGATYLGQKVKERVIDLIFYVRGTDYNNLHSIRNTIINYIKNDRVKDNQPFVLRYIGADSNKPVQISCVYDSGMEWKDIAGIGETIALRVIAYDPFFYEDGTDAINLTANQEITNANYAVKKIDGTWARVSAGLNGTVYAFTVGLDGSIYIAGEFTNVGDANGDYIVKYDPITGNLTSLGTGLNDAAYTLVTALNGDIYVGGAFTSAGGVASTARIAKWNVTSSVWQSVGGGIAADDVTSLVFGHDGILYIGGTFTNHGDANGDYITRWNGSAYSSLGTGMNNSVSDLKIASNGDLIASGYFTTSGGTTTNGIARWNGTAWSALGTGLAGGVITGGLALAVDKAGNIYVGGDFTSVDGVSANYIAKYNGVTWEALGTGANDAVYTLAVDNNGLLYAGGYFTSMGGLNIADRVAVWNGSTWSHIDIDLPGLPIVNKILVIGNDLYLGYSTSGTAKSSYLNTVTNLGTVTAYPQFYFSPITVSGVLQWIKNETIDKTLFCNYTILPGEILIIDLDPNERKVESSYFGNVIGRAILRNSDFADFNLLPGVNNVSVFVTTSGSVTSYITYPITHWSADGVA